MPCFVYTRLVKQQKEESIDLWLQHLSSVDYTVLATKEDKAMTERNAKAIFLYRTLLCKLLYKQLILVAPRRF